ncbi:sortase [Endozoicomonas sp. G2_1]|uniref:sortase domain-containing protein n=1 Tax=Endozoicomonas sp. G2_1 TaxID=2821091 RepID=UPI001ADCCD12|nr:sortase [Endozoicomonas sp. G2_1]MBO9491187.1 sortase [Endozoicomonas sp. G2_1]
MLIGKPETDGDNVISKLSKVVHLVWLVPLLCSGYYLSKMAYISVKAELAQYLLISSWQQIEQQTAIQNGSQLQLTEQILAQYKPWHWADFYPVARLTIPKITLDQIVVNRDSGQALAFAPGLMATSISNTDEGSSIFIAGHNDTHFDGLDKLIVGDTIRYQSAGKKASEYRVSARYLFDTQTHQFVYQASSKTLYLVTCFNTNQFQQSDQSTPYRLIVEAELISN